jgi:hypothetical protein
MILRFGDRWDTVSRIALRGFIKFEPLLTTILSVILHLTFDVSCPYQHERNGLDKFKFGHMAR